MTAPRRRRRRDERGAVELELVIVVPVLMMIVLFVVWAGRVGNAGLAVELAAEEAAVAASLAEDGRREQVARDLLELRPDLDFLCIDGPKPVSGDRFVTEVQRDFPNERGVARTIGLVGVALRCETDGSVPVLRGLAPTVVHYGRGSEVYVQSILSELPTVLISRSTSVVIEGPREFTQPAQPEYKNELDSISVPIEITLSQPVTGNPVRIIATTMPTDPASAVGGTSFGRGGCGTAPDANEYNYFDYINTTRAGVIPEGELRLTIPITIIDDCIYEQDESFRIDLTAQGAVFEGEPSLTVTILDNDPPPIVGFVSPADDPCYDESKHEWRLNESGNTCTTLDLHVELRHPTQVPASSDPDNPAYYYPRVRYGVTGRDFRITSNDDGLAADNLSPAPVDCSVGDFTHYDEDIVVLPPPTPKDFMNSPPRQQEDHKKPTEPLRGYNSFTKDDFSELEWNRVLDDTIDEPEEERLTLQLTGLDGEIESFTSLTFKDTYTSDQIRFSPQLTVVIIDDDPPPEVTPLVNVNGSRTTGSTPPVSRSAFNASSFELKAGVAIDAGGTSLSHTALQVATTVGFTFSKNLVVPDGEDFTTLTLTFTIPACNSETPTSDLVDLKAQATALAATDPRFDIADLTMIEFTLAPNQPGPGTPRPGDDKPFNLATVNSWSIKINP